MSDSLEEDAPRLLWMLCSSCYAVHVARGIASMMLVGALREERPDLDELMMLFGALRRERPDLDELTILAMSLLAVGVEALAFSGSSFLFPILGFCVLLYMPFCFFRVFLSGLQIGGVADYQYFAITAVPLVSTFILVLTQWPLLVDIMVLCAQLITSMVVSTTLIDSLGVSETLVCFLGERRSAKRLCFNYLVFLSLMVIMFARRGLFLNILALTDMMQLCAGPAEWLVFRLGGGGPNVDLYGSVTTAVMMGLFLVVLAFATRVTVELHPFVSEAAHLRSSNTRPKKGFEVG